MMLRVSACVLFTLLMAGAVPIVAQDISPSEAIAQTSSTTYLDLARKLMPGATADGSAEKTIPLWDPALK